MALKGLLHVVTVQVLGRVSGDCDIVIVKEAFDVKLLRNGETSGLGIVSLCGIAE